MAASVGAPVLVLLNLSRDQFDRNNEVRHVVQRWRNACEQAPPGALVVANADDPLADWAASAAKRVAWGRRRAALEKRCQGLRGVRWPALT